MNDEDGFDREEYAHINELRKQREEYFFGKQPFVFNGTAPVLELQTWQDRLLDRFDERVTIPKVTEFSDGIVIKTADDVVDYAKKIFADTSNERTAKTADQYWQRFRPEYVATLDNYAKQIPEIETDADVVVLITARNEVSIDRAIKAIVAQHNHAKLQFIVANNYHESEANSQNRQKIDAHLAELAQSDQVAVINMELPDIANAGFAKKIAKESVIRRMYQDGRFVPILSVDADVESFDQDGWVDTALSKLQSGEALAVSSDFDYSPESQQQYPVWGYRCKLMQAIKAGEYGKQTYKPSYKPLIGANFLMHPNTYMMVGGYNPKYGEDRALDNRLREATRYTFASYDPVAHLGTVYINPSKEMQNLIKGDSPESHWFSAKASDSSNDTLRFNWREELTAQKISPWLAQEVTAANAATAISSAHKFLYEMFGRQDFFREKSATFVLLRGIDSSHSMIPGIKIKLKDGTELSSADQVKDFVKHYADYSRDSGWPYTLNTPAIDSIEGKGSKPIRVSGQVKDAEGVNFGRKLLRLIVNAVNPNDKN